LASVLMAATDMASSSGFTTSLVFIGTGILVLKRVVAGRVVV
jgi:hypothetical protein